LKPLLFIKSVEAICVEVIMPAELEGEGIPTGGREGVEGDEGGGEVGVIGGEVHQL
jgi:hypothetical protein